MTTKFIEMPFVNLRQECEVSGSLGGSGWVTLDCYEVVRRHFTLSPIPSLFGSHIMEIWPDVNQNFWKSDEHA
jgi:hypothetical protein